MSDVKKIVKLEIQNIKVKRGFKQIEKILGDIVDKVEEDKKLDEAAAGKINLNTTSYRVFVEIDAVVLAADFDEAEKKAINAVTKALKKVPRNEAQITRIDYAGADEL